MELFFSILARWLLKRGEFASVEDLVAKVMAFIDDYNPHRHAVPLDLRRPAPQGQLTRVVAGGR